jgi:hypothetical protein
MLTSKSNMVAKFASDNGLEVIEVRLPESLPFAEFAGFPFWLTKNELGQLPIQRQRTPCSGAYG